MHTLADTATLLLAGDVMTGGGVDLALTRGLAAAAADGAWRDDARAQDRVRAAEVLHGPIRSPLGPRYVWGDALQEMGRMAPDACIVNLETAITADGEPWPGKEGLHRMNPLHAGCLKAAKIDACCLANDHVLDFGQTGMVETLRALGRAGICAAGAGVDLKQASAPAAIALDSGPRLLVYAWAAPDCYVPAGWDAGTCRAGIALLHDLSERGLQQVTSVVHGHRREGDLVLLSIHWGGGSVDQIPAEHRRFARELIDQDLVDVVHGHGAHHPLPFEVHRGKLILYGCGDLINDREGLPAHAHLPQDIACLYVVTLSQASGRLVALRIVPFQRRAFRLVRADASGRNSVRQALRLGENGFARRLRWRSDGHWLLEAPAVTRTPLWPPRRGGSQRA